MTPRFTTRCYVRVDDKDKRKEVCDTLAPVGYKIKVDYTEDINPIVVASTLGILHDASHIGSPNFINCGTNINLFLALAGMRSDTDKGQRFTDGEHWYIMNEDKKGDDEYLIGGHLCHRATAAEIIEHFKNIPICNKL